MKVKKSLRSTYSRLVNPNDHIESRIEFGLLAIVILAVIVGLVGRKMLRRRQFDFKTYRMSSLESRAREREIGGNDTMTERTLEEKMNDIVRRLELLEKEREENNQRFEKIEHELEGAENKLLIIESNQQAMRAEFLLRSTENRT